LALENICKNNRDILAIVPTHLAGIPIDFNRINEIAKRYGVFTVEDCAQALGAEYKSKKVGTLGDFSFFSFARGKGFTIYEGGAALANNEKYSHLLAAKIQNLARKDFISESIKVLELIGYWIFYNPYLFWFVFSLPQIFWQWQGKNLRAAAEQYSVDFATSRVSNLRKFLGCLSFYRLDEEIKSQREKAAYYLRALNGVSGLSLIKEPDKAKATYPYLVLLFDDIQRRQKILTLLRRRGLGASIVYLSPITGYDYLKSIVPDKTFPLASNINQRQITLSTNSFLKERDLAAIAEIIKNNE
jgi:dTDP-4-amino-4,6-dideoxygalactose transaminase